MKVSYSGEFYFKATFDMVIYIYRSAVTTIPIYIKTFQIKLAFNLLQSRFWYPGSGVVLGCIDS